MSRGNKLQSTEISPTAALFSILGLLVVMGGVIFGVVRFMGGSSASPVAVPRPRAAATVTEDAPVVEKGDRNYALIARRALFRPAGVTLTPPVAPPPVAPPVAPPPTAPPPMRPVTPFTPPPPPGPKLAYTGLVEIGDQQLALVENLDTQVSQYIRTGEQLFGFEVTAITHEMVMLKAANGTPLLLKIGENKSEVPTTPAAGAKPNTPQPPAQAKPPEGENKPPTNGNGSNGHHPAEGPTSGPVSTRRAQEG